MEKLVFHHYTLTGKFLSIAFDGCRFIGSRNFGNYSNFGWGAFVMKRSEVLAAISLDIEKENHFHSGFSLESLTALCL